MRNILFMFLNIVICFRTLLISLSSNLLTNIYELGSTLLQNIALKETQFDFLYSHQKLTNCNYGCIELYTTCFIKSKLA